MASADLGPVIAELAAGRTLAPLMIGVTGKLDLEGLDGGVRASLDAAFARIDARCPGTPKVLLSALARGADTIAAQVALARGWNVVAPLPFEAAIYAEDFDGAAKAEFEALLTHPGVRVIALDALRREEGGTPYAQSELSRQSGRDGGARTEHYEQVGLYIAERSAVLMAVMKIGEEPGKTGGTARIVHHRLHGELDETEAAIRRRSDVLSQPVRLDDAHAGPVWVIDLMRLRDTSQAPAAALMIRIPGHPHPASPENHYAIKDSFLLADAVEELNRRIMGVPQADWATLEKRAGPHTGDAGAQLQHIRLALSAVQGDLSQRVRWSIIFFAATFCCAIVSFELYAGPLPNGWTALGYPAFVGVAFVAHRFTSGQRWQRLAEDYRAASEALRVQKVWWSSGLTSQEDRVGRFYLRGAQGAPRQLRIFIDHVIASAETCFMPPTPAANAVNAWAESQIDFFDKRIASRRRWLSLVQGVSWFLLLMSVADALCMLGLRWDEKALSVMKRAQDCGASGRAILVGALLSIAALLFSAMIRSDLATARREEANISLTNPALIDTVGGGLAGLFLALALFFWAAFAHFTKSEEMLHLARELVAMSVIVPAAIAGASRFIADKLSWEAEMSGYEHACERFRRGLLALHAAEDDGAGADEERRQVVLAMGAEALSENENWLRAHRERPLEPLVGG